MFEDQPLCLTNPTARQFKDSANVQRDAAAAAERQIRQGHELRVRSACAANDDYVCMQSACSLVGRFKRYHFPSESPFHIPHLA
jgi:hypothetical protein